MVRDRQKQSCLSVVTKRGTLASRGHRLKPVLLNPEALT